MSNAQKVSDERLALPTYTRLDPLGWKSFEIHPEGVCVKWGDYKALLDHLLPYKEELLKIAADVGEPNDPFAAWEAVASLRAAPTPDAHSEVGAKALEWKAIGWVLAHANTGLGHWYGVHAADPLLRNAPFRLTLHLAHPSQISISGSMVTLGHFDTIEEAKAAAQADFAQRIQSCLTVGVVKAEPVAITDEMVERGLAYYSEGGCLGLGEWERREVVTDILTAALASKPEEER